MKYEPLTDAEIAARYEEEFGHLLALGMRPSRLQRWKWALKMGGLSALREAGLSAPRRFKEESKGDPPRTQQRPAPQVFDPPSPEGAFTNPSPNSVTAEQLALLLVSNATETAKKLHDTFRATGAITETVAASLARSPEYHTNLMLFALFPVGIVVEQTLGAHASRVRDAIESACVEIAMDHPGSTIGPEKWRDHISSKTLGWLLFYSRAHKSGDNLGEIIKGLGLLACQDIVGETHQLIAQILVHGFTSTMADLPEAIANYKIVEEDQTIPDQHLEWLELLPPNLRPSEFQIAELEQLRINHGIPSQILASRIMDSRVIVRRIQAQLANNLRKESPNLSELLILEAVLAFRACIPPPVGWGWEEEQLGRAMQRIDSFDDLVDFIIQTEEREFPREPDPTGLGNRIDEILST